MEKPDEERIRVRAHQLWEAAGKPEDRQDEFWHQAERELSEDPAVNEELSGHLHGVAGAGRRSTTQRRPSGVAIFPDSDFLRSW